MTRSKDIPQNLPGASRRPRGDDGRSLDSRFPSNDRSSGLPPQRGTMFAFCEALDCETPEPVYGAYPMGFVEKALEELHCRRDQVLHVCSGRLTRLEVYGGLRVDLRAEARPDVRADGQLLPFLDESFAGVLLDPPYSEEYAQVLYGTRYPIPGRLLAEAARVVRQGGRFGLLHYLVASPPPGCKMVKVIGVTTGANYRIRALTIYKKKEEQLRLLGT